MGSKTDTGVLGTLVAVVGRGSIGNVGMASAGCPGSDGACLGGAFMGIETETGAFGTFRALEISDSTDTVALATDDSGEDPSRFAVIEDAIARSFAISSDRVTCILAINANALSLLSGEVRYSRIASP